MSDRALSFGRLAEDYDRVRPGYPPEALRPVVGNLVVEVGAGTGKLTALLAPGRRVVAVEPDPAMRAVLDGRGRRDVEVVDGTGERLPVGTGEASAVVYGQSWHWVEPTAAAAEARRVLADHGVLLLLWNVPDVSVDWVRELNRLAGLPEAVPEFAPLELAGFSPGEVRHVPWQQPLTVDDLVLLFSTFSRVSTREPADRDRVLESIRASLAGRSTVSYPYVCVGLVHRRTPG
ncbi:class I SAM-dependent methyltransferase [Actinomycetospora chiangmaiensis]|uniref:class I SAM-dependent methyltransferase n=1 Tax=Actinomycetospora chiangmaiensis TaxID=402650 RepID=UPI00036B11E2|nr:class I SAM-dependent methyltransferase [Actinomycetospora chiangmaiensis]